MNQSKIFVIATPIGNLSDMTFRAIETLKNADIIAAEDTRVASKLLKHFDITYKELISYYDQVEEQKSEELIHRLSNQTLNLAIMSDAGTPCISDPGYKIVAKAKKAGIAVHPIPGASAVVSLISAAGLPCDRFSFVGFLPTRDSAKVEEILTWQQYLGAVVFFESNHRIVDTLETIEKIYPNAEIAIGRELTKLYEEITTLPIGDACQYYRTKEQVKGELVCMIKINTATDLDQASIQEQLAEQVKQDIQRGLSHKDLMKKYASCGLSKKELYAFLLGYF